MTRSGNDGARQAAEQPRLTVAVLAGDDPAALAATVESVRDQHGVEVEILVLESDSGSRASRRDRALKLAATPLVAFLSAGDRLVPGALRAVADRLISEPRAALAHGYLFRVDPAGRVPKLVLRQYAAWIRRELPADLDHRASLIAIGNLIHGLPTYRRDLVLAAGGFGEAADGEEDQTAALRLLDRHEVCLVPALVCGRPGTADGLGETWAGLLRSVLLGRRLVRRGEVRFLTETPYQLWRLALIGVGRRLRARRVRMLADRLRWRVYRTIRGTRRIFSIEGGVIGWIYDAIARRFEWWPFAWGRGRDRVPARSGQPPHVGYVIWHYPTLSETFIRREIHALRRLGAGAGGIVVDVLADGPDAPDLDPDPPSPRGETAYLEPHRIHRLRRFALRLFLRHPLRFINLALYLVTHRYGPRKRLQNDFLDFRRAVELARLAEERGVTHLHAPWADAHAVLARVAARLLDLPYSVQARAHEIHSETFNVGLREKLDGARFIVTNSRFNEGHLRELLGQEAAARLHVIFNGVQLIQFEPSPPPAPLDSSRPIRLLSVGRLVEQKGFEYLLQACRLLRDRRVELHCQIIGGAYPDLDANTFVLLKKLHRRLELEGIVSMVGSRRFADVLAAYRSSDIVALPCVVARDGSRDVTPNVLFEAMAMRLPVVSTPVGAIPEIVDHGVNGWLVPSNDATALADAIEMLARDPELRQRLGGAARQKVEERFDSDRNVRRYAELFGTLTA